MGYGGYGLGYYGKREADAAEDKAAYYDGQHSIDKVLNFWPF